MPERTPLTIWLWEHHLTQSELAAQLNIHPSTVNRACTTGYITAALWAEFADRFGIPEARAILGALRMGAKERSTPEAQP